MLALAAPVGAEPLTVPTSLCGLTWSSTPEDARGLLGKPEDLVTNEFYDNTHESYPLGLDGFATVELLWRPSDRNAISLTRSPVAIPDGPKDYEL